MELKLVMHVKKFIFDVDFLQQNAVFSVPTVVLRWQNPDSFSLSDLSPRDQILTRSAIDGQGIRRNAKDFDSGLFSPRVISEYSNTNCLRYDMRVFF